MHGTTCTTTNIYTYYICTVGWSDFREEKSGHLPCTVVPNCSRIPIPKFHFLTLIHGSFQPTHPT